MTPQLLELLAKNKGRGYFRSEATADSATIYLYDAIVSDSYWGGVSAIDFIKQLSLINSPVVHLRINSPGGDVFAARAMAQAIKEHPSQIIAHIDGYAASAATFLAIAATDSVISDGAMFMVHNAWTIAAGNAKDFNEMAMLLERTDKTIINDYMAKTGKNEQQIKDWMDAETYFFGQEAVDAGFINAIADHAPKNSIDWDLSAYAKLPKKEPEPNEKFIQQNQNRLRVMQAFIHH
jgi:ATP-dependent Clp protease protease subunit